MGEGLEMNIKRVQNSRAESRTVMQLREPENPLQTFYVILYMHLYFSNKENYIPLQSNENVQELLLCPQIFFGNNN